MEQYNENKFYELVDIFSDEQALHNLGPDLTVEKIRLLSEFIIFGEKYNKDDYFQAIIH